MHALVLQGGAHSAPDQAESTKRWPRPAPSDWVAGISIGAINCALIAGNLPERRVDRLRAFWRDHHLVQLGDWANVPKGDAAREWAEPVVCGLALVAGAPGFFAPRYPPPLARLPAPQVARASTTQADLEATLDDCRLRSSQCGRHPPERRLINVRSGNFVYFDYQNPHDRSEHLMASAALPPGFPPIAIEGEHYCGWRLGLQHATPVGVESQPRLDTLAFQVDLWSARGELPRSLAEDRRAKREIQYSSRTRASTDSFKRIQRLRRVTADLLDKLPEELRRSPEPRCSGMWLIEKVYNIVHLSTAQEL